MVLLTPITIRFSKQQHAWLAAQAHHADHDRISVIVRALVEKAMKKTT